MELIIKRTQLNTVNDHDPAALSAEKSREDAGRVANVRWTTLGLLIAVVLPALVAFGVLYRQRISVPYHDDYGVILVFANQYQQLHGFTAKLLDIATSQNNDYKLGFVHFVVAMELELTGHLNFAFLVALGNIFLLAIGYLLWCMHRRDAKPLDQQLLTYLPISLLFFSLTYWETLNWAMAGLQNLSVILFSLLAIYLLFPGPQKSLSLSVLLLACCSAMLAAFSSANGFLLAPVGFLMLVRSRAFRASVVWCLSFGLPIAAYRYHYIPYHISVETLHRGSYIVKLCYIFAFLGCAIQERWIAALLGFVIVGVLILAIWSGFERTDPVRVYLSIWILLSALPVAWLRQSIASRYSIYSLLLMIFSYSLCARYLSTRSTALNRKRLYALSIILAGALWMVSDITANAHLGHRQEMILSGIENYRANPEINSPMNDPDTKAVAPAEEGFQRDTLNQAIAGHVYTLPTQH